MNIHPIKALSDNYIWAVVDDTNTQAVIVDPGESEPVIDFLNDHNLVLAGILITHHHTDHTDGLEVLLQYAGEIAVFGSHKSPNPFINHRVQNGDLVHCAHLVSQAIEIPGHTLDHTAYYSAENSLVFTGDTLFSAGCGRIFEGTPAMMYSSLAKLAALPDDTEIYCGHEYTKANLQFAAAVEPNNADIARKRGLLSACTLPSVLSEEKSVNPFLRCEHPDVIASVENYAGEKLLSPTAVFARLREWKNGFKAT